MGSCRRSVCLSELQSLYFALHFCYLSRPPTCDPLNREGLREPSASRPPSLRSWRLPVLLFRSGISDDHDRLSRPRRAFGMFWSTLG